MLLVVTHRTNSHIRDVDETIFDYENVLTIRLHCGKDRVPTLLPDENNVKSLVVQHTPHQLGRLGTMLRANTSIESIVFEVERHINRSFICADKTFLGQLQELFLLHNTSITTLCLDLHEGMLALLSPTFQRANIHTLWVQFRPSASDIEALATALHNRTDALENIDMDVDDIGLMAFLRPFTALNKLPKNVVFGTKRVRRHETTPFVITNSGWRLLGATLRCADCSIETLSISTEGSSQDATVVMELLCHALEKNITLTSINIPDISFGPTSMELLSKTLLNDESIAATYKSNHTLKSFGSHARRMLIENSWYRIASLAEVHPTLHLSFTWNRIEYEGPINNQAIAFKILYAHFGANLSLQELQALPKQVRIAVALFFDKAVRIGLGEEAVETIRLDYYTRVLRDLWVSK